jgi:beta-galactosidase/beta-glucuronidase
MLDIYDRVGVVVMDENRDFELGQRYYDNMGDLVQRDRNHPSVVIWSFCNEGGCTPTGAGAFFFVWFFSPAFITRPL